MPTLLRSQSPTKPADFRLAAIAAAAIGGAAILAFSAPALAQDQYGAPQGGPPPSGGYNDYQGGPPPRGQYGDQGAPSPRGLPSEARFVEQHIRHIMRADTNGDGRVSLSEWMAWRSAARGPEFARRQFEHLDVNHDGYLTPAGLRQHEGRLYSHLVARRGGGEGPSTGAYPPPRARGNPDPQQGAYPQGPGDPDGPG